MSVGEPRRLCGVTTSVCEIPNTPVFGAAQARAGAATSIHAVRHYQGGGAPHALREPVLEGLNEVSELSPGMRLRRIDARDLQGASVRMPLRQGLHVGLVVGGQLVLEVGGQRLRLGPDSNGAVRGILLAATRPDRVLRESGRGHVERTIALQLEPAWLARCLPGGGSPELAAFAGRHLALWTWPVSGRLLALAGEMLGPPAMPPALWRLYQEARALEILLEALNQLRGGAADDAAALSARDRRRMTEVRELLDSGQAYDWTLSDIAARACVSVNTLQRHFRAMWGTTVAHYQRDARLDRARVALERDGASVADAAWLAGYGSAANFATAFRRRYGISPGQLRARR